MSEVEMIRSELDLWKEKVETVRKERDDLLHQLDLASSYGSGASFNKSYDSLENLREIHIETIKSMERNERRYRMEARGLCAKIGVMDDQLHYLRQRRMDHT